MIATLLGVSRQSVNEALGELKGRRIVETGYRRIKVLDAPALIAIAEQGTNGRTLPAASTPIEKRA